jgi:hypothetical protein
MPARCHWYWEANATPWTVRGLLKWNDRGIDGLEANKSVMGTAEDVITTIVLLPLEKEKKQLYC